jgi:hypothetical protein
MAIAAPTTRNRPARAFGSAAEQEGRQQDRRPQLESRAERDEGTRRGRPAGHHKQRRAREQRRHEVESEVRHRPDAGHEPEPEIGGVPALPAVREPQGVGEAGIAEQHGGGEEHVKGHRVHTREQELRKHDGQGRQRILDQRAVQAGMRDEQGVQGAAVVGHIVDDGELARQQHQRQSTQSDPANGHRARQYPPARPEEAATG